MDAEKMNELTRALGQSLATSVKKALAVQLDPLLARLDTVEKQLVELERRNEELEAGAATGPTS